MLMNSDPLSVGKIFLSLLMVLFYLGCTTKNRPSDMTGELTQDSEVETSLSSDQKEIEKLRANIPEDIKRSNDSLKEIIELMGELKVHPSKVREKFDKKHRDRRNDFQKDFRKTRENFNKDERKKRDAFLANQKKERDSAKKSDMTREQNVEFYAEIDRKRRDFFAEQNEIRRTFDSEQKEKSQDFYEELNQQRKEFNEEWKSYNQRWQEWQKNERDRKRNKQSQWNDPDKEIFNKLQNTPSESLKTDE